MLPTLSIVSISRKLKAVHQQSKLRWHSASWWTGGMLLFLLTSCATAVPPIADTPVGQSTPSTNSIFSSQESDESAITRLILVERQAAIDQDLALLGQLWRTDARIVDGRNSVATNDDYIWPGRAAILDRYRVAVFPFVLPPLTGLDAAALITITGNEATVRNGTDTWQLHKAEGRWWLLRLSYQMTASN